MSKRSTKWSWTRYAVVAGVAALAACGGGGGDGGGDGPGDDPAPTLPTNLAFAGGLTDGVPMIIAVDGMNLSVTGFGFRGTWDRTANHYTLPANETSLNIDLGNSGVLVTGVTATASWLGFVPPAESGTISAQSLVGAFGTPLFTGIASVKAVSDSAVQLSWSGTTPPTTVNYSWDAFLNGELPSAWEQGIQAGFGVLALGVEKLQFALDQFVFINAYDAQLVSAGSAGVTKACDAGSGTRKVVWNDSNGDGALGPGDGFTITFANCRIDMPGDIDQLLNGQIVMSGYIENSSPYSVGARVDFVSLRQAETDPQALAVTTTGSVQMFISGN